MGTPIGTPPNAIALKYLNDPEGLNLNIGFGEWMSFMLPYTIIVLFIAWFILLRLFPFKQKSIELQIEGEAKKDWRSIGLYHLCYNGSIVDVRQIYRSKLQCSGNDSGSCFLYNRRYYQT